MSDDNYPCPYCGNPSINITVMNDIYRQYWCSSCNRTVQGELIPPTEEELQVFRAASIKHCLNVTRLLGLCCAELVERASRHDQSKFEEPELSTYAKVTPRFKGIEYGSEEYRKTAKQLGEAVKHHFKSNDHHPEYFANGVNDMNLFQFLEMCCDHVCAAREREPNGSINIAKNIERFKMEGGMITLYASTIPLLAMWYDEVNKS